MPKTNRNARETATRFALMLQVKATEGGVAISMAPTAKSVKFDQELGSTRE